MEHQGGEHGRADFSCRQSGSSIGKRLQLAPSIVIVIRYQPVERRSRKPRRVFWRKGRALEATKL